MAAMATVSHGSQARAWLRAAWRRFGWPNWLAAGLFLAVALASGACVAEPVKGDATLSVAGGYARLVLKLDEDVDSEVTVAGTILIIRFKHPVDIPVGKLSDAAPDYVGSARRDPDGSAIRLALSRKVTVNSMTAGERTFIDLLPDTWKGLPPGLPPEVVKELSDRARAAERALRQQRIAQEAKKRPPIRVRASVQPTFVRFVFELPEGTGVNTVLNEKTLALTFGSVLSFDLADAKLAAPPNVASIGQRIQGETSTVEVALIGDVDVHSFREEKNYIVDIGFQQAEKPSVLPKLAEAAANKPAPADKSASEAPATRQTNGIVPPTSESIAREAKLDVKGETKAQPEAAAGAQPAAKPEPAAKSESPAKPEPAKPEVNKLEVNKPEVNKAEIAAKSEPAVKSELPAKSSAAVVDQLPATVPAKDTVAPMAAGAPAKQAAGEVAKETAKEGVKEAAKEAPVAVPATSEPAAKVGAGNTVDAKRSSDSLRLTFSFASPVPAALFRRADVAWLVFDSVDPINLEPIRREGGSIIAEVNQTKLAKGQAIRIRFNRPQLASLRSGDEAGIGRNWVVMFADSVQTPAQPLAAVRNIGDPTNATVAVPLSNPGLLHRLVDPDAGDALIVVTAPPPVRGFVKRQDFVEFSLLESAQGVVIAPNSDEIAVDVAPDKITVSRPGGLTLSSPNAATQHASAVIRPILDLGEWRRNQQQPFDERLDQLINDTAQSTGNQRATARLDLARFYLSRGLYPEAKATLDLVLEDAKPGQDSRDVLMAHAIASILMGRPDPALKELANPVIGGSDDVQLWKALAYARQEKWAQAREKFKNVEAAVTSLPVELQRMAVAQAMRASLEAKDFSGAAARGSELELLEIPPEMKPSVLVMQARLDQALGRETDALSKYDEVIASSDRPSASEAKLLEIELRQKRGEISQDKALRELETLAATWRGDSIEIRTLQLLARIYSELGRYNDALSTARTATDLQSNSEISRQIQDEAAALFSQIFLGPKGDNLPLIDALAMFYEYRELTPIGSRGDEMIRRLADRLVAVDLLDQASQLLQYQVDHRLEGAARAQVASRLAMVYLMNRKPERAIAALGSTRIADLAGELRQQRLLLQARAESDVGRRDFALDIIANVGGREAIRLRSDIYWAARRWREASEQIELYYGDRWRDFTPLNAQEKGDVIRAVLGYALAEDALGLARFREKYAPLMSDEKDQALLEAASRPASNNSADFSEIAKMAASVDTLDGFLRDMKVRFPDSSAKAVLPAGVEQTDEPLTGALPAIIGTKRADAAR
jgi:tetratricopeptide (TPR) repeat protein